jgi:valyl-tRNA synthetase
MDSGEGGRMPIAKRYDANAIEPRLLEFWHLKDVYRFDHASDKPLYAIDTPPPTVSGELHLGHVYSYSQTDFLARFWRMQGYSIFYPMGFDDNGLPTERLVERKEGMRAEEVGRARFIEKCLEVSEEAEVAYKRLWQRLGLSVDWRFTYRTIDQDSLRTSQWSFIDLYQKGLVYRQEAPTIWCPECQTALAQADLNDLFRNSVFYTIDFRLQDGGSVPIATTRPELLPACVAVMVHPEDPRAEQLRGGEVRVPLFDHSVPILTDPAVKRETGTGLVMCCTFGDALDIEWWYRHDLPLRVVLQPNGQLKPSLISYSGMPVDEARQKIIADLHENKQLLHQIPIQHTVRIHERCDTPVEYLVTKQWFLNILDSKEELLKIGRQITWHPPHMFVRYRDWVTNLQWDWCISRQRTFGVPFPVWYCDACEEVLLASLDQLPVDPSHDNPSTVCACGGSKITPELDVMDTWATSSLTPQIVGRMLSDEHLYEKVFPMTLRPQAHEIIRTWAFYTIAKSFFHFGVSPWEHAAISGWGLAPRGEGKISKSRGGGPIAPHEMILRYSADAVRYWAGNTGFGKDSIISERTIQAGAKLVNKLWNVARFVEPFLDCSITEQESPPLLPTDRWILSKSQHTLQSVTYAFKQYDFAAGKNQAEAFFWTDLADNYLELAKQRLYDVDRENTTGARFTLSKVFSITLRLFAPFLPFVTEEIYQTLFAQIEGNVSIHTTMWPEADPTWQDHEAEAFGETVVKIVTAVRRFKSERHLSLATKVGELQIVPPNRHMGEVLCQTFIDLQSATRAETIKLVDELDPTLIQVHSEEGMRVGIKPMDQVS